MDRVHYVDQQLRRRLQQSDFSGLPADQTSKFTSLSPNDARELFRAQCYSRALDITSRLLQSQGQGYYTIGSSGHEGIATLAHASRTNDIAFLHYRDAAFQLMRAQKAGYSSMVWDMLLSFACAKADPISGGRHKVLGSKKLFIPPQTSTIASHLPKAVGAALSISLSRRHPQHLQQLDQDGIVLCSFGDASLNHSSAQGALNTTSWLAYQSTPLPLLMICEDNGIGISVKTPKGWVEANIQSKPCIRYFSADGCHLYQAADIALQAVSYIRMTRKPAFLHLKTVRLYGHAGADIPSSYLSEDEIKADEARDPLLYGAKLLAEARILNGADCAKIYIDCCQEVTQLATAIPQEIRLQDAQEIAKSLIPPARKVPKIPPLNVNQRTALLGQDSQKPQPMGRLINWALHEEMARFPEILMMGEDIGRKGGVYGITRKLQAQFGRHRVMDSLLDEQSILGMAIGLAHNGFLPIAEIQFLAYLHNAEDQLRGEAATLSFFSNAQFTNPMLIRIAGLGYQKGFGGHFHNDNSIAVLRDIPGLIIACPSCGTDAVLMMRESIRLVREEQRIVVFLEPIALYGQRDLIETGDNQWLNSYPNHEQKIEFGQVSTFGSGDELAIISYGNGYHLSRQAAQILEQSHHCHCSVIDLRWLGPLPMHTLLKALKGKKRILIVDECRASGNLAEGLFTQLSEQQLAPVHRLSADDCFIATGPGYAATMPNIHTIIKKALCITS